MIFIRHTQLYVKAEHVNRFIDATRQNAIETTQEAGNVHFELLRDTDEPQHFTLIEIYDSREALNAHHDTEHYTAWREATNGMFAKESESNEYERLYPFK